MNNVNRNSNNQIFPLVSPADSGLSFSIATLSSFAISLLYTIIVSIVATSKGMSAIEFSEAMQGNYLFNTLSYLLSASGLFVAITVLGFYKKQRPFFGIK